MGSWQFPLSTKSSCAHLQFFLGQARNLGIPWMLLQLVMSICRCTLTSFTARRPLRASPLFCCPFCTLRQVSQFVSNCRTAQGRARSMGHAHGGRNIALGSASPTQAPGARTVPGLKGQRARPWACWGHTDAQALAKIQLQFDRERWHTLCFRTKESATVTSDFQRKGR